MRSYTTGDTEGGLQHSGAIVTGAASLPQSTAARMPTGGAIPLRDVTGSDVDYGTSAQGSSATPARLPASMGIDEDLLGRAGDLIDTLVPGDALETPSALIELCGTVMEMWETAGEASEPHRTILAELENGVLAAADVGSVSDEQIMALREALRDLARKQLSPTDEETIRERFLDAGFGPMSYHK